jgi:hypothetical protein
MEQQTQVQEGEGQEIILSVELLQELAEVG